MGKCRAYQWVLHFTQLLYTLDTTCTDMAHMAKEEDTYMGYRIPKGAVILANIW